MAKTLTLHALHMSQFNGAAYDVTSDTYNIEVNSVWLQFEPFPASLLYITPTAARLSINCTFQDGYKVYINSSPRENDYYWEYRMYFGLDIAESIVDIPSGAYPSTTTLVNKTLYSDFSHNIWMNYDFPTNTLTSAMKLASNGGKLARWVNGGGSVIYPYYAHSDNSQYVPYLTLTYDEGAPAVAPTSPIGYVDRTSAQTFRWSTYWTGYPVEGPAQNSATLQWKNGNSGSIHDVSVSGNRQYTTLAANTLPQSQDILWRVRVQTASGTLTSDWTHLQTADASPVASAVTPNGSFVDGSRANRFTWTHSTETGTAQTKYDLQIFANNQWQTISTASTSANYADIPANTLPSGTINWRVRTYNADNTASEWSQPLTCVVISQPNIPAVEFTTSAPFASIRWTATDQQAVQIRCAAYDTGLIYGTAKTFTFPSPLAEGTAQVSVRVMNTYGLWSEWSTAQTTIVNTPGSSAPSLTVDGTSAAQLSWTAVPGATAYWVYRNGAVIKKTADTSCTDRLTNGISVYFVRAILSDGINYSDSPAVSANISVAMPELATLDGQIVSLGYSVSSMPQTTSTLTRAVSLAQYNNGALPTAEIAPYRSRMVQLAPAYSDLAEAAAFEDMLGKLVCYRNQYGDCIVGIISAASKVQTEFYVSYTATLQEVDPSNYAQY